MGRVGGVLDDDGTALISGVAGSRSNASLLVRRVAADHRHGSEVAIAHVPAGREGGVPRVARSNDELVALWTESGTLPRLHAARLLLSAVPGVER